MASDGTSGQIPVASVQAIQAGVASVVKTDSVDGCRQEFAAGRQGGARACRGTQGRVRAERRQDGWASAKCGRAVAGQIIEQISQRFGTRRRIPRRPDIEQHPRAANQPGQRPGRRRVLRSGVSRSRPKFGCFRPSGRRYRIIEAAVPTGVARWHRSCLSLRESRR